LNLLKKTNKQGQYDMRALCIFPHFNIISLLQNKKVK
jgi:hypothetical protein